MAGDVSDNLEDVRWALELLRDRFARVVWIPGNHELWTYPSDDGSLRGEYRYRALVEMARSLGVDTPEDPYPVWEASSEPVIVAPLFLLYDYSFGRRLAPTPGEALARAHEAGVVCSDEFLLKPDPFPSVIDWCHARVRLTEHRLADLGSEVPMILVNHYPLHDAPTRALRLPEFAQWCGTALTADWHRRFEVAAVAYGHLHIPRTMWLDGVRFEEVSLGYPREWQARTRSAPLPRQIWPQAR